ncbi:E3 ubiquitin-protein ligase UPL6 [Galdieria sulphuraria]|nr:E3 ubiquitin-protein ligase UPL6 [Galdieria sulphuraria]
MNFFDGQVYRRKGVSLRGNSGRQEDGKRILERAREERALRERQRLEEKKAVILQSFLRAGLQTKKAKKEFEQELDELLKLGSCSVWTLENDLLITRAIRLFLFTVRGYDIYGLSSQNYERLCSLCKILLKWLTCFQAKPYLENGYEQRASHVLHITSLLGKLYAKSVGNPVLEFCKVATTLEVFAAKSVGELLDCSLKHGVYESFRIWLLHVLELVPHRIEVLTMLFRLLLEPLKTSFATHTNHRMVIFGQLFSISKLLSSLPDSLAYYLIRSLGIEEIISQLSRDERLLTEVLSKYFYSSRQVVGLLDNLIYIMEHLLESSHKEDISFMASYVILLSSCTSTLQNDKIFMNREEKGQKQKNMEGSIGMDEMYSLYQQVLNSMKSFFKIENIRNLFRTLLCEADSIQNSTIIRLSNFMWHFARMDVGLEHNLITALAFWPAREDQEHVLVKLWSLCSLEQNLELFSSNNYTLGERSVPFTLFCRAFTRLVYFQDNEEFYQRQKPFSLEKVRTIASLVKQVLFRALWSPAGSVNPSPNPAFVFNNVDGALEAAARLLAVLRSRDSKQRFAKEGFWETGGGIFVSDTFIVDAAKSVMELEYANEDRSWFEQMDEGSFPSRNYGSMKRNINVLQLSNAARNILRLAPFMIPFESRLKIFHYWIQKEKEQVDLSVHGFFGVFEQSGTWVTIRRDFIVEDAFAALNSMRDRLKQTIRLKFIDTHGLEEAGIDGGGVFKEFMHQLIAQALSPSLYGLFRATSEGKLYPNPASHVLVGPIHLEMFEFLGRMLGKAIFDRILVDLPLATFFLSKLLGEPNYTDDLESLDPEMYKNLMYLKHCDSKTVEEMNLTFTIMDNEYEGGKEVALIPNGQDISVTAENRIEYINRVAHYRMNVQIKQQCDAFLRGLCDVVSRQWIRIFSPHEMQLLISGVTEKLNVIDLKRYCHYSGGYHENHRVISWFWEVFEELSSEKQANLLQFVTSSPRAPLLGFRYLDPAFTIHRAEADDSRLPTASTCMNLLKLPEYSSKEVLKNKLLREVT